MSDLTISAFFTQNGGAPATGLTLADVKFFLTRQNKSTGVDDTVWDGTQVATVELNNIGAYTRILSGADLTTYDYFATVQYAGATVLDSNYCNGATGQAEAIANSLATQAKADVNTEADTALTDVGLTTTITGRIDAAISTRSTLTAQQVWEYVTRTLTASSDPTSAAIVSALLATTIEGRSFQNILLDVWAQVIGDFAANDGTDPTSITYDSPDGTVQITHTLTDTTRTWS